MHIAGLLYGSKLLDLVGFEHPPILGPEAATGAIEAMIDRYGSVFVKPVFAAAVGKKGKANLVARAFDVQSALEAKVRLYFATHSVGNILTQASGVTFEACVPSDHEIYFSLSDSTKYRAPTATITHFGGVDIEQLDPGRIAEIPFDSLTGLTASAIAGALAELDAPAEIISPLAQALPSLWELMRNYGVSMIEINPIRMRREADGRLIAVACDFKCSFDRDDPRWRRLGLPATLFSAERSAFEAEINVLRTYQGQSDVFVLNPEGSILPQAFGGGAGTLVTEILGDAAILVTDFGGNPPYAKMKDIAEICLRNWLPQANVLLVIGGRSNNTDILATFQAIADALRSHFAAHGPTPVYVVVGRGGPNLVQGMTALARALDDLQLPYVFFGLDSELSQVVRYAHAADRWMKAGGRAAVADRLGLPRKAG